MRTFQFDSSASTFEKLTKNRRDVKSPRDVKKMLRRNSRRNATLRSQFEGRTGGAA